MYKPRPIPVPLDALPHSHHRNDLPKVRDGDAFVPQLEEEGEEGEEGEEEGEEGEGEREGEEVRVTSQCE